MHLCDARLFRRPSRSLPPPQKRCVSISYWFFLDDALQLFEREYVVQERLPPSSTTTTTTAAPERGAVRLARAAPHARSALAPLLFDSRTCPRVRLSAKKTALVHPPPFCFRSFNSPTFHQKRESLARCRNFRAVLCVWFSSCVQQKVTPAWLTSISPESARAARRVWLEDSLRAPRLRMFG